MLHGIILQVRFGCHRSCLPRELGDDTHGSAVRAKRKKNGIRACPKSDVAPTLGQGDSPNGLACKVKTGDGTSISLLVWLMPPKLLWLVQGSGWGFLVPQGIPVAAVAGEQRAI